MAVRLSALRTGRTLLSTNIFFKTYQELSWQSIYSNGVRVRRCVETALHCFAKTANNKLNDVYQGRAATDIALNTDRLNTHIYVHVILIQKQLQNCDLACLSFCVSAPMHERYTIQLPHNIRNIRGTCWNTYLVHSYKTKRQKRGKKKIKRKNICPLWTRGICSHLSGHPDHKGGSINYITLSQQVGLFHQVRQ
jgi:hypothetical protein